MTRRQYLIETEKQKVDEMFKKGQRKIDIAKVFSELLHYHKNYKTISGMWNC